MRSIQIGARPPSGSMNLQLIYRITGIAVFIQLALGGLVTFNYLDAGIHIVWGVIVGVLVIVTLVFALRLKPRPKQLVGITAGLGVDMLLQAILGFAALGTGNNVISWVHFLNSLAIYGMGVAATFMAMGVGRMMAQQSAAVS